MAPALLLSNFSPVGPAILIALMGTVTVFMVWFITREWFASRNVKNIHYGALAAATLYAISPVVIIYSKSSWNPNIMPFFSLLCIYSLWQVWEKANYKWLVVLGISFSFVLQSHYLGLLLLPTIFIFWFIVILKLVRNYKLVIGNSGKSLNNKSQLSNFIKYSLIGTVVFLFLMSPLVIFDARHGWQNFGAISKFFSERQTTVSIKPWKSIPNMFPIWKDDFITRIVGGKNATAGLWIAFGIFDLIILYLLKFWKNLFKILRGDDKEISDNNFISSLFILTVWLFFAILGLGLYKQHIYDHYFGFIFAAPFILFGGFYSHLWEKYGVWVKALLILVFAYLICVNLRENPLKYRPNMQMKRAQIVADKIKSESGNEKFNLAVIAKQNYEDGYQYFLEKERQPVFDIDPLTLSDTVANQLFVVCEMPKIECDPTHSPKAEIANFGWSKIDGEWEVGGVIVYKLIHTQ